MWIYIFAPLFGSFLASFWQYLDQKAVGAVIEAEKLIVNRLDQKEEFN